MTANQIITIAKSWIGTPYRHQASLKHIGCDCLGLVRGVWREVYGVEPETTPNYAPDWAESGLEETLAAAGARHMTSINISDFTNGDLLLFRWKSHLPAKHAGIAIDRTRMIHAQENVGVVEIPIGVWWQRHLAFAFRFPKVTL